ncbi:Metallophosphoesterase 1 [Dirofilaria immitis]|nr:Metallophosphoesterase 1 [Dirofilaria immitis]
MFMAYIVITARTTTEKGNTGNDVDRYPSPWALSRTLGMANVPVVSVSYITNASECRFLLGDLFDESTISGYQGLVNYVNRFNELFMCPRMISPGRLQFLSHHFSRSFADHIVISGNHFVLLNSMTVERDGCSLCSATERQIEELSQRFDCTKNKTMCSMHSRPILLLHIPLYRKNDAHCPDDSDASPEPVKSKRFHVGIDCLSNASSHYILEKLKPRAVFNGHTHYSCQTWWRSPYNMFEWTLSSFSWRNIPQPAFLLVTMTSDDIQVNKCFLPNEKTVIASYVITALVTYLKTPDIGVLIRPEHLPE